MSLENDAARAHNPLSINELRGYVHIVYTFSKFEIVYTIVYTFSVGVSDE